MGAGGGTQSEHRASQPPSGPVAPLVNGTMQEMGATEPWRDAQVLTGLIAEGLSNREIGEKLGTAEYTIRKWRKRLGIPPSRHKGAATKATFVPIGSQVSEEEMLRERVRELERTITLGRKDDILHERMISVLHNELASKEPQYEPAAIDDGELREHEMALHWSDTHAGEIVSADETNGLNEYDWPTMMQRHDSILRGVISYKNNRPYPIRKLTVLALGDMLSGNIHRELAETNEFPLIECAIKFGLDAAEWLERLVPEFERIHVAGVVGNHPRMHNKPSSKQRYDNFDWLVYHTMQQRLREYASITWDIPKAQKWPVMIAGRRVLMFHGDGIRSTMVDVPWGGIIRYVNKLSNQYAKAGMPVDHFTCGHYHEANVVKNRQILMNGSVKGVDEYSIDAFGGGSTPTQLLTVWNEKHGLTDACFIDL